MDAGGAVKERLEYDSFGTVHHDFAVNFERLDGINPDLLGDYTNAYFALENLTTADHAGSPAYSLHVDINGDGVINSDDLGDFINLYFPATNAGAIGRPGRSSPVSLRCWATTAGAIWISPTTSSAGAGMCTTRAPSSTRCATATTTPRLGRWLQRDPAGFADSMNLYGYGWGSPVGVRDPYGLDIGDWWRDNARWPLRRPTTT